MWTESLPAVLPKLVRLRSHPKSAVYNSLQDDTNAANLIPFADLIRTTTRDMLIAEQNLDDNVALGERFRATCISTVQVGMADLKFAMM